MTSALAWPSGASSRCMTAPDPDGSEALIARSWQRSLQLHGLDRAQMQPRVLPESSLRDHREPLEPLLALARSAMETLYLQLRDVGYVILLTDADGVAIDFIHNPRNEQEARRAGLTMGGCWTEAKEGTCAVGIALAEKLPITVHHGEHFLAVNGHLTCSAAPIFDPDGRMLAVLDASALHSPEDRRIQRLVLKMVQATACTIEDAHFLRRFDRHLVLRTGSRQEFLEVTTDGLLALDEEGRIVAANQRFLGGLGLALDHVRGEHIEDIFDVRHDALLASLRHPAGEPLALRVRHTSGLCFARVRGPRHGLPNSGASNRAMARADAGRHAAAARDALEALGGDDPHMQVNVKRARRILDKDIPVLLLGESGTGKELFARAMHACSRRAHRAFVAINCAAIPETLLESELFGYGAGAFTGARAKGAQGKIVQAQGGTLFLDEVGDMPLAMQTRLLRVLAEREVIPLGAEQAIAVDMQLICATHRTLDDLVSSEQFRLDLYYRINGLTLTLPPLRQREDRVDLILSILADEARQAKRPALRLSAAALDLLDRQRWPGNVRQLRYALRLAAALCDGDVIDLQHLPDEPCLSEPHAPQEPCAHDVASAAAPGHATEGKYQRATLVEVLQRYRWNVSAAARQLGISRSTLYRQMSRFHIVEPNRREGR